MRQRIDYMQEAQADTLYTAMPAEPDQYIAGDADFYHETPVILIRKASDARRTILRALTILQVAPETDQIVRVSVWIDSADRYSSGGETVTPASHRPGWTSTDRAAEAQVYQGSAGGVGGVAEIVATGLTATARQLKQFMVAPEAGKISELDFEGDIYVDANGTILIYVASDDAPASPFLFNWKLSFVEKPI